VEQGDVVAAMMRTRNFRPPDLHHSDFNASWTISGQAIVADSRHSDSDECEDDILLPRQSMSRLGEAPGFLRRPPQAHSTKQCWGTPEPLKPINKHMNQSCISLSLPNIREYGSTSCVLPRENVALFPRMPEEVMAEMCCEDELEQEESTQIPIGEWRLARNAVLPNPPVQEYEGQTREQHITCKAWSVVDMETGAVVEDHNSMERVSPASMTKIMTALVILEAAEKKKRLLKAKVKVSARAASLGGTTAALQVSQVYTVQDLLYGLMLPSGNDAAIALAEHFGRSSLFGCEFKSASSPYRAFIAKMNKRAGELDMAGTKFHNAHGLFHSLHWSCASDVIKLSREAMKSSIFRRIVSTRRYYCLPVQPGSKTSKKKATKKVWVNTNQLLWEQGMDKWLGGKTGWLGNTHKQKVHGCLSCFVKRGTTMLCSVVIGSEGCSQRFADMKRLVNRAFNMRV